ncbi:hypothetical protein [Streptosporangium vulgare]|uniref:Uncharacterized protein n=1 Tax=Streptosporangium vulgare TaxID=46190 RepID=A0ABV5TFW5_9ACTN
MTQTSASEAESEAAAPWGSQIRERLWAVANVIAPTTVVTTLLFYFGYVATTARFGYFGVYLEMVDLSLQEMLLFGVEVVFPPLIVLALVGLLVTAAHTVLRYLQSSPDHDAVTGWAGLFTVLAGLLALTRGVVGLRIPQLARTEATATTPLSLTGGVIAISYGCRLLRGVAVRWARRRAFRDIPPAAPSTTAPADPAQEPTATPTGEPAADPRGGDLAAWLESPTVTRIGRYALAWVAVIVVAASFWTANSFAADYGRGRALDDVDSLGSRPEVVLYTKEPLRDVPAGVGETVLATTTAEKEPYRFRYRGLRLLVESNARLFLVPAVWIAGNSRTLVIPYDNTVRIHLVAG